MKALMKAKTIGDERWISGTGITDNLNIFENPINCIWSNYSWIEIDINTICYNTGYFCVNGESLYDGDIIRNGLLDKTWRVFLNGKTRCWSAVSVNDDFPTVYPLSDFDLTWFKIIGNKFDK